MQGQKTEKCHRLLQYLMSANNHDNFRMFLEKFVDDVLAEHSATTAACPPTETAHLSTILYH